MFKVLDLSIDSMMIVDNKATSLSAQANVMLKLIGNWVLGRVSGKGFRIENLSYALQCYLPKVELTYINDTSKSDIHIPLQDQRVHQIWLQDVHKVWVEVI